ncbi:MAG: hypothetical protein LBO76_06260 [Treponema sp.]|jgi:hypothetical protein|nr:hypothetical protein [Treponema sp.]
MSDSGNPWQSPSTEVAAEEGAPRDALTPLMIRHLKDASPWLRFLGIVGYIGAVFVVLLGLVLIVADLGSFYLIDILFGGLAGVFMGLLYIAMGVVAFFPARFTHRFGVKIRNYLLSGGAQDLETAFRYNRALWKFNGILAIVYLSLVPLVVIGSMAAAFITASQF